MQSLPHSNRVVFYTLDYENGKPNPYEGFPYYVASPFNFDIQQLADDVLIFLNRDCPQESQREFLEDVKNHLGL